MSKYTANIKIGHATDTQHHTGCTVFVCPENTVGGVDIRGMAPGSRETALLDPVKSVADVTAVLLTGGSAFGLATADGVMKNLSARDIGHYTPIIKVPIVPTAVVFDLFMHMGQHMPGPEYGFMAVDAAFENAEKGAEIEQGCIGVGAGVTVGKWKGIANMMKSGFGIASMMIGEAEVFAAAVVNAIGDVVNEDGTVLAGARDHQTKEWLANQEPIRVFAEFRPSIENTTLVVIGTTAKLDKAGATRLAQRGHDGMAIAIRPVHTMHDGDTIFALSTGDITSVPFDSLANGAVKCVEDAIRNAVRHAHTVQGIPALKSDS
ncbi:MAG: L-aminopeptidase/D-esterase-like protein [Cellvibrionaceae bacterium]|jgi:L-aminopeptidase/D-esterase-like protein